MNSQNNENPINENPINENTESFDLPLESLTETSVTETGFQSEEAPIYRAKDKGVKKTKNRLSSGKKALIIVPSVFLGLIAVLLVAAIILVQIGKSNMLNTESMMIDPGQNVSDVTVSDGGKNVTYGNKVYAYNENMTAILCIGVDREEFADKSSVIGTNGQADALFLFCMDTKTGKSTIVPISRDTMADIDIYSPSGKYVSSSKQQICLSYAYGDGRHGSCENTVKSVSRLFYGLPINTYVAVDLKAIEFMTKTLGGVKVTPTKDFTYYNGSFKKGKEITLKGERARAFVQERDKDNIEGSLDRMERQRIFIDAFFNKVLSKTKEKITTPVDLYNAAADYMITNMDVADISFMTSVMLSGSEGMGVGYASIEGKAVLGEEFVEYYPDETSIYDKIIEIFYTEVKK